MKSAKIILLSAAILLGSATAVQAQLVPVEGYVFEENNRGYLKKAKVIIMGKTDNKIYLDTITNKDGMFITTLPKDQDFTLIIDKKSFFQKKEEITTRALKAEKLFIKSELERKPGYVFDVTLAEAGTNLDLQDAIQGARIEIYNNTTRKEELVLDDYPYPNFKFTFEIGNHYTIMIRREDYFTKRVEAYVNVAGCILCFEGLSIVNVTDVMTSGNNQGTFLANVEMTRAEVNTTFKIENIYYDYDKDFIRPDAALELDKLVTVLKDNQQITVEMGSHTDSRGRDAYNLDLSQRRAKAAHEYLLNKGISSSSLTYKGYGESDLVNSCKNGAPCTDLQHQENRRTELKIVGIKDEKLLVLQPLKKIIEEERLMEEVNNSPIIKVADFKDAEPDN